MVTASIKNIKERDLARLFTQRLLYWHKHSNNREMPWKEEKDPYKIWLSEIILQQTRVEQGLSYYEKFVRLYPTVKDLADANPDQVFKAWEGLGYYSRCKNLIESAKVIATQYQGKFPRDYDQILALKGVGPYTAAAISAFAYNQPYAVLDGNVFRVLSRIFGIHIPIDSTEGKKVFQQLAEQALDPTYPAKYNQAIMDFGATVCKPASPICSSCPMTDLCMAKNTAQVNQLPKKEKTLQKKTRHISWFILELPEKGLFYIQKRPAGDIWENLHEFYPIETTGKPEWSTSQLQELIYNQLGVKTLFVEAIQTNSQQLTHQKIFGYFFHVQLDNQPENLTKAHWFTWRQLQQKAFPKLLKNIQTPSFP